MRLARRDFLRAAEFSWNIDSLAALSTSPCTTFWYLAAASKSPPSAAVTAFFVKVRIVLLRARLARRRFSDCRWRFMPDKLRAITSPHVLVAVVSIDARLSRPGAPLQAVLALSLIHISEPTRRTP